MRDCWTAAIHVDATITGWAAVTFYKYDNGGVPLYETRHAMDDKSPSFQRLLRVTNSMGWKAISSPLGFWAKLPDTSKNKGESR